MAILTGDEDYLHLQWSEDLCCRMCHDYDDHDDLHLNFLPLNLSILTFKGSRKPTQAVVVESLCNSYMGFSHNQHSV